MGLDIYLHKIDNFDETRSREREYEEKADVIWNEVCGKDVKYENIPQDKKDEASRQTEKLAESLGLDKYGQAQDQERQSIELPSTKHPECYWKIGYFRSSYNPAGFNTVVRDLIGRDLYYIFEPPEDEYEFSPDWEGALERATEMHRDLTKLLKRIGNYKVTTIEPNIFAPDRMPKSKGEAMDAFLETKKGHSKDGFDWFENGKGHFYLKPPMQILSAMPGIDYYLGKKVPVTYLVYKTKKGEGYDAYLEELEVCIEAIEWVLAQPDSDKYYLGWSG